MSEFLIFIIATMLLKGFWFTNFLFTCILGAYECLLKEKYVCTPTRSLAASRLAQTRNDLTVGTHSPCPTDFVVIENGVVFGWTNIFSFIFPCFPCFLLSSPFSLVSFCLCLSLCLSVCFSVFFCLFLYHIFHPFFLFSYFLLCFLT